MDLEDAARQLLERVLIDARVVQRDLNSGVSVHDFDIIRSDESVEALEVTRFTDQKLRALGARLDSFAKSFNTEAIAQRWWVGLTEAVLDWGGPREVAEELVPLLADLEASGTYDFQCDLPPTPNTPEVQTLCERLPVSNGQTLGTKAHPRLMLGIPSFVTSFSPDDINRRSNMKPGAPIIERSWRPPAQKFGTSSSGSNTSSWGLPPHSRPVQYLLQHLSNSPTRLRSDG